ncbi:MAG: CDP-alcohol phosphatidyltransferase family protein [Arenimonas sp.]
MSLRWLPNAITIARMVLALPLLWALATAQFALAFWLAVVAGVSDAADGWLARRFTWASHAGSLLDPLADKLLLGVCFAGLWWSQQLPTWLVVLVLARDVVIVAGALVWWRALGPFEAAPTRLSKINTLMQIVLVAAVLADAAFTGSLPAGTDRAGPLPLVWLQALLLACAALTLASGLDYVIRYGSRFRAALRNRP